MARRKKKRRRRKRRKRGKRRRRPRRRPRRKHQRRRVRKRRKRRRRRKRRPRRKRRKAPPKPKRLVIDTFALQRGRRLAGKYEVVERLGIGWEGEVYKIRELSTGIERAAKFFFPQRNPRNRKLIWYARKLHKLRDCPIVIQYQSQETVKFRGFPITFLVSEFVEGELLSSFLARQRGGRLSVFQALHLLHSLAAGVECIHQQREYHGDLHTDNVIVRRHGLGFNLKLLDLYHWEAPKLENIQDDVVNLVQIFHETLGGARHYARLPQEAKGIISGLKRSLILEKFRTAGRLRAYLETMHWQ